ncbi:MAG TPA: hypothetical protein VJW55_03315 [Candidatus Angelobacter sp.]|nr:hypothetical protein [Candidatus Angelobacter sp.]
MAQSTPAKVWSKTTTPAATRGAVKQLSPEQKFVVDTVRMAVALPQSDQQDRLRVLSAAADVISPIDKKMAKSFWSEGVGIESELVRLGQTPAVSMMANGQGDCTAVQSFVENLPENAAMRAEQSLIGALTTCPKQTLDPVSRKLDAALNKGIVPSRAIMATIQAQGEKSAWSQAHFAKMFASLPDPQENAAESQNLAAMYSQMAGEVSKDTATTTGLQLLDWLGKLEDSPLRGLSIRITSGAMQQALGDEAYQKALQSDVAANTTVQNVGPEREIQQPQEENVSVLEAMSNKGADQTEQLRGLPPTLRAREAAADGFAAGTSGNKQQARKYFDMAFSAADEVWDARTPEMNAAAVVQEISEAAAQVDSLNALARAQKLHDSSAQAISMLAVARVVASNGITK